MGWKASEKGCDGGGVRLGGMERKDETETVKLKIHIFWAEHLLHLVRYAFILSVNFFNFKAKNK